MDKPIGVGDLVVVCRACPFCGNAKDLGQIYRVEDIYETFNSQRDCCGDDRPELCAFPTYPGTGFSMQEIKRIPPIEELESEKQKEDIREPA